MARLIILSLFVICFICVLQVYAAPADKSEESFADSIKNFANNFKENVEKKYEDIKPDLEKFGAKTSELFKGAYEKISKGVQEVIPKKD